MTRIVRSTFKAFAITIWLGCVGGGFGLWENYETTAGPNLPIGTDETPQRDSQGPELSVYVHPHCPCAMATVAEMAELASRLRASGTSLVIRIVFIRPSGVEGGWERTRLWSTASAISGVQVVTDECGNEAKSVGAATSGCAVFRDAQGTVKFRGGLTSTRGRTGESRGLRAIQELIAGKEPAVRETPTFGCPLFEMIDELPTGEVRHAGKE
jgi:hypothetical protein